MAGKAILDVRNLSVAYRWHDRLTRVVDDVSFEVMPGETVALVGESGSGKSTTAHAVLGLLHHAGKVEGGEVFCDDREILHLPETELRKIRGVRLGLVPQDPGVSLDPIVRVGKQVAEILEIHGLASGGEAAKRAEELIVGAGLAPSCAMQYPHELSGGMQQRVLIAMASACNPILLVADEPTSSLDVTVQKQILDELDRRQATTGMAILLITHNIGIAADRARRVIVMSQGRIVEMGPTDEVLKSPKHEYTKQLLSNAPDIASKRLVVSIGDTASRGSAPPVAKTPLLTVRDLAKAYGSGRSAPALRAVDGVSFDIFKGETFGLVGESGAGKSTLGRIALRLISHDEGTLELDGHDITSVKGAELRSARRRMQLVQQNPYASLDPRMSIGAIIEEPLRIFSVGHKAARRRRALELLEQVGLPSESYKKKPSQLSGGQRQRVAIARALAIEPELIVCDEPTSALDVTIQFQILELLARLQAEFKLTYLLISHDLAVVRQVSHRVGVMRHGKLLEVGDAEELFKNPTHPYTRELVDAIPGQKRGRTG